MENHKDMTKEKNEISKFVAMKLPLVLRDYQSYFEAKSRDINIIMTLKGWEISLISALSVFLLTKDPIPYKAILPLYIIVIMFWLLDSRTQVDIDMRHKDAFEKERNLQEENPGTFQQNIISWKFVETKEEERNNWRDYIKILWNTFLTLFKLKTYIGHFPLAIIICYR